MSEFMTPEPRFAILIDADNISDKYVKIILDEVANAGVATYKRIYGDWTSQRLASWKNVLLENSIIPMQQYSYTYGKSSTDSAMIIDAMDILYSGHVDGFAIVSSDSDFTRLAARLRESGMQVIGMGEQKTPEPFISACNQFKYLDLLLAARKAEDTEEEDADEAEPKPKRKKKAARKQRGTEAAPKVEESHPAEDAHQDSLSDTQPDDAPAAERPRRRPGDAGGALAREAASDDAADDVAEAEFGEMSKADRRRHMKKIRSTVNAIVDKFSDDEGWVSLGRVGEELSKRLPDFDVRNYGFKKLRPFLKSLGDYDLDEPDEASGQHQIYLRIREQDN